MAKSFITIIILCLVLTGMTGLAAAGASTVNAGFEGNITENSNFSFVHADKMSASKSLGEQPLDWKGYYAIGGKDGWVSVVDPQIGKTSMRIVAVRPDGYNGISMDLIENPLNISGKHMAVCVKSSDWSKLEEANLILANSSNLSSGYVFDIKDYFHKNFPANGKWAKVEMDPAKFKVNGNPDGTNIIRILFQIKGEECSDLYVDGFGYSQLLSTSAGKNISDISNINVIQTNVSNATANQSAAVSLKHHHHHRDEEDEGRARIVRPSDKMDVQFNIVSPSETVIHESNVILSVASNLTSDEAKHLALKYEWNISKEGSSYSAITGNNQTIGLPNGNYTAAVTIKDQFGRTESLERSFAVENVSVATPGITPSPSTAVVPSPAPNATPNFTITPSSPPAIESGGGTGGNLWQWAIGLQLNTSDFSLSNFHIGSISWLRGETYDASAWEAYRNGKDLRTEYLRGLQSDKKIAYVLTLIHGDGGKEISSDLISMG